jgi:hypothetical protein
VSLPEAPPSRDEEREFPPIRIRPSLKRELDALKPMFGVKSMSDLIEKLIEHYHETRGRTPSGAGAQGGGGKGGEAMDPEQQVVEAMKMLDGGMNPIEVMENLKIPPDRMMNILNTYNEMREAVGARTDVADAMTYVLNIFGERIRGGCEKYDEESGVCTMWYVEEADEIRRRHPSLFKVYARKPRFRVGVHPWVCTLCRRRGVRAA